MGVTAFAGDCNAAHAETAVFDRRNVLLGNGRRKTRPAGAGLELCIRIEQRRAATDAAVNSLLMLVPVASGKGPLRPFMACDFKLFRRELLLPFVFCLDHLGYGRLALAFAGAGKFHDNHSFWLGFCSLSVLHNKKY